MGLRSDRGVSVVSPGITLPDRYQPLRKIARGGMASVWCAHDRVLDRRVAIKLLAEPYADDELAVRRFMREARTAARLSGHANVVTIYDVGRAPEGEAPLGRPFIVMEYLPGGTVADALRTGELDQQLILKWLREAATALDYAHRRGVIHRDVKLSNFLLDRDRELHVADFGIAQLGSEDTLTTRGQVLGTAAYLAPERALGLPATEASDRYALAVAAYELLVGERPFTAQNFAAQARQHVQEAPPKASLRNRTLPSPLDPVLAKGMAKQQEDRFPTARALVDAIEGALPLSAAVDDRPIQSPPARATPPTPVSVYGRRSGGRVRMAAVAAIAAVLIAVGVAAGATLLRSPSHPRPTAQSHRAYAQHAVTRHSPSSPDLQAAAKKPATATTSTSAAPQPPPPQPTPSSTAASLESQGHSLMLGGQYQSAIPVLRQAVAAAPHSSLTYAYALFDLGRSLRLAGDPRAAVQVLYQRLQIPNQTDVVRSELALALEALGQSQAGSGLTASNQNANNQNSPPPSHGHHHGSSGGAPPGGPQASAQGA